MNLNATLFFECLFFLIFIILSMKFIWPVMNTILEQRRLEINLGLEKARAAKDELHRAQLEAENILGMARVQADAIIKQSMHYSQDIEKKSKESATNIKADILEVAHKEIERAQMSAQMNFKSDVAHTALVMMKKILVQNPPLSDQVLINLIQHEIDDKY